MKENGGKLMPSGNVWVVWYQDYEDTDVVHVASSRNKAQEWMEENTPKDSYMHYRVVKFEIDGEELDEDCVFIGKRAERLRDIHRAVVLNENSGLVLHGDSVVDIACPCGGTVRYHTVLDYKEHESYFKCSKCDKSLKTLFDENIIPNPIREEPWPRTTVSG